MKEKINIAELLKDCPKGMELDCTMFNDIVFNTVEFGKTIIVTRTNGTDIHLDKYGTFSNGKDAKCVIFPKGKTTWEGFQRPFKDGDIIYVCDEYSDASFTYVAILKQIKKGGQIYSHCFYNYEDDEFSTHDYLCDGYNMRFATEEEKAKLFQAIKDNGYRWNAETKTLEKLIEPRFKVGDRITLKNCDDGNVYKIIYVKETYYVTDQGKLPFYYADSWELVPDKFDIATLVPFESRVLVRNADGDLWKPAIYGFSHSKGCYVVGGVYWAQCIPYEANKELLGTTNNLEEYGSR